MARKRPVIQEVSYGLYERFDAKGKGLPKLLAFTTAVPAVVGQEFGFIIKIKHGRGLRIDFEIDHPQVPDQDGKAMEPFRGEVFVRDSDFDFFLGDALWEPIESMVGEWTLSTKLDGKEVNRRTFEVVSSGNRGNSNGPDTLPAWDDLPMQ